jgi:hypothetical protein
MARRQLESPTSETMGAVIVAATALVLAFTIMGLFNILAH